METTLNTLKNNYAQEQGYEDWRELQEYHSRNPRGIECHMNEICIRAQKAALEKAAESAMVNFCHKEIKKEITDDYGQTYWVDSGSITNPENLIK